MTEQEWLPRLKLLPQNLYIADIDRHRLHSCTHTLLQILLFPTSEGRFFTFTQTPDEVSLVLDKQSLDLFAEEFGHDSDQSPLMSWERAWRAIRLHPEGDLGFDEPGIINSVATPLADAHVPVFYISTFGTDYLMVEDIFIPRAIDALCSAGFQFTDDDVVDQVVEEMASLNVDIPPRGSPASPSGSAIIGIPVQRNSGAATQFGISPTLYGYGSPTATQNVNMVIVRFHQDLCMCRFTSKASVKDRAAAIIQALFYSGGDRFISYTETEDEVSILMDQDTIGLFPEGALEQSFQSWTPLRISEGSVVADAGIISKLTKPLARAGISILNISTFSSDYAFVTSKEVGNSLVCLRNELNLITEDAAALR